ncbi:MAG: Flp pilus assembly protein CpaB [Pseudorhodobacter sp.]|nr:Flp pilus assembly protein CpaB [Pseudorhodobacter sp.]
MLRAIIVLVALSAGGVAAWLSLGPSAALSGDAAGSQIGSAVTTTDVLVAATDLDRGSLLNAATMHWQPWPQNLVNAAFITRSQRPDAMTTLTGLVLRNGLTTGEPIFDAKLAAGDTGALSILLASGKRAIAVRISAENSAGGFILPNDRVDVLLTTTEMDKVGHNTVSSHLILKNVKVLAVDQTIDSTSEAVVGKTATLELTPAEVEIVTAAETAGAISLALRPISENGEDSALPVLQKTKLRIFRGGQLEVLDVN